MKKHYMIVVCLLFLSYSFSQTSNYIQEKDTGLLSSQMFSAYYPDGTPITFKYRTMGDLFDSVGMKEHQSFIGKDLACVYYKKLSDKPLLYVFHEKNGRPKIPALKAAFLADVKKRMNNYDWYWTMNNMLKKKELTTSYLEEVFGQPTDTTVDDDGYVHLYYKDYNAEICFDKNGISYTDAQNFKAFERNGLSISRFDVTDGDYSIGFNISLKNYSRKTIKYAWVTVTAWNPVDDKVATKVVQAVGPIKPGNEAGYKFDDIIYSRTAESLTIEGLKIQFMDGTIKLFSKAVVKEIRVRDWDAFGNRSVVD